MKTWEINEVENEGYMHACLPAYPCANTPLALFLPLFLSDFVHYASMSVCVSVCVCVCVWGWAMEDAVLFPLVTPPSAVISKLLKQDPCRFRCGPQADIDWPGSPRNYRKK